MQTLSSQVFGSVFRHFLNNVFHPRYRTGSFNRQSHVGVGSVRRKEVQLSAACKLNTHGFCKVNNLLCLPSQQTTWEGDHAGPEIKDSHPGFKNSKSHKGSGI